jgi:hypothetical protein
MCVFWYDTPPIDPALLSQQWLGPTVETGNTMLYRKACDISFPKTWCDKCVNLRNGVMKEGQPIEIWDCDSVPSETWLYDTSKQALQYKYNTSWCIDAGVATQGLKLQLWECNGQDQQKWLPYGAFQLQSAKNTTMCIDVSGGSFAPGTQLQVWPCAKAPGIGAGGRPEIGFDMETGRLAVKQGQWNFDTPKRWECQVDGTCGPSLDPLRANWDTQSECESSCGGGSWACWNSTDKKSQRPGAKWCTPCPIGTPSYLCSTSGSVENCEKACQPFDDGFNQEWMGPSAQTSQQIWYRQSAIVVPAANKLCVTAAGKVVQNGMPIQLTTCADSSTWNMDTTKSGPIT